MLVDSHCHLDRLSLDPYPGGLEEALDAARQAGVSRFLCIGIDWENAPVVVDIAERHPDVTASVGIHPLDLKEAVTSLDALRPWLDNPKVVAVGETGLDYHYSEDTADIQKDSFRRHLVLAAEAGLPVVVHSRNAREDTLALLGAHASREAAGVMHCFTESRAMAEAAMELGFYISFSGIVTFRNAADLREVVRAVPLDRLLIETDSPYLAPVPYRGKRNEPRYLPAVAECVAELKGVSVEALAEQTAENFQRLFSKAA